MSEPSYEDILRVERCRKEALAQAIICSAHPVSTLGDAEHLVRKARLFEAFLRGDQAEPLSGVCTGGDEGLMILPSEDGGAHG